MTSGKMSNLYVDKCIFCQIAQRKDKKTEILFENEEFMIFKDIKPATKHHYLVITKSHIKDPKQLDKSHTELVERMHKAGEEYLKQCHADLSDTRYGFHWPPFNSISHLHLHVISSTSEMGFISRGIFKPNSFWFVTVSIIATCICIVKIVGDVLTVNDYVFQLKWFCTFIQEGINTEGEATPPGPQNNMLAIVLFWRVEIRMRTLN